MNDQVRQRDYWPTDGWRTSSPGAQQIDEAPLHKVDAIIREQYPHTAVGNISSKHQLCRATAVIAGVPPKW
jgi:hypothetical protein